MHRHPQYNEDYNEYLPYIHQIFASTSLISSKSVRAHKLTFAQKTPYVNFQRRSNTPHWPIAPPTFLKYFKIMLTTYALYIKNSNITQFHAVVPHIVSPENFDASCMISIRDLMKHKTFAL